jgi:2,5-diketo-D-gluconate reductase A
MLEKINVFDFQFNADEMRAIELLELQKSQFFSHQDPEMVERLTSMSRNFD